MEKIYSPTKWVNDVTPINQANLNKIEQGLDKVDTRVVELNSAKANQSEVSELKETIDTKANQSNTVSKYFGNLFDGNYVLGEYVNVIGVIKTANGYARTNAIYLESGTYIYNRFTNMLGDASGKVYVCDSSGNISQVLSETNNNADRDISMINLESGYYMFNCGYGSAQYKRFMIIMGNNFSDFPSDYLPYDGIVRIEEGVHMNETMKEDVKGDIKTSNPLFGKTIAFEGDSICEGEGYAGGYGKIIADRNNMTYYNTAVGGAVIPFNVYTSTNVLRHSIAEGVANMNPSADYLIFEGGVNDASLSLPIGADVGGYPVKGEGDILDTSTVLGALEYACRELVTTFAGKKVGYIFVHKIYGNSHVWNTSWRDEFKKIFNKWGIPYLDLQNEVPPLNMIASLKTAYTKDGDGWHPNEEGYKKFYCDKIEAWLKTL